MAGPGIGARTGKELSELIKDAESRLIEANRLTRWRSRRHPRASRLVRFVDGPVLEGRRAGFGLTRAAVAALVYLGGRRLLDQRRALVCRQRDRSSGPDDLLDQRLCRVAALIRLAPQGTREAPHP